jgi:hypothetical protein
LKLLNSENVDYLLVGGYAVGVHGYPRSTADLDVWVAVGEENAARLGRVLEQFGFSSKSVLTADLLREGRILRMGVPPLRIEIMTQASGVSFPECYAARVVASIDGIEVNVIDLDHLKVNKRAAGRLKDLAILDFEIRIWLWPQAALGGKKNVPGIW